MVKLLWWTGDGPSLLAKPLERNRFWPQATDGTVSLSQAQQSMLQLEGIDWRRTERTRKPRSGS